MTHSKYTIQIVDQDGHVAFSWIPGSHVEKEFVKTIAERVNEAPVGVFTTRAQVAEAVRTVVEGFLYELKSKVRP